MQLTVKESGALGVLTLQGRLTKHHADELKICLRQALSYVDGLIVDCGNVTGVDPACLQIICSAYRQSQELQKKFTLAGHQQELFLSAARASEYVHCVGCGLNTDQGCIWGMT